MGTPGTETEDGLRQTLALLRESLDAVPGWLALVAADGRYLVANRKYADAFGKPIEQIVGHRWQDVFPELAPVHGPLLERCLAGETVVFDDVLPLDPARPTRIHGVYRPVAGPDGSVQYISVMVMDVTDRVEAEEDLRRTREVFRAAIDNIPGWLTFIDPDGRYVVANRKYTETFGKPVGEIEGRIWWEVFPALVPVHRPLFDRCLSGEVVPFDDVLPLDPARPTHIHGVYRPVLGPDGAVQYVTAVVLDITDRVEAEEALRTSEERLRLVTDAMDEAIGIRDGQTQRILFMNRAHETISGLSREELERDPRAFLQVVHPDDRERFLAWMEDRNRSADAAEIEFRMVRADGQLRHVWSRGNPILAEDGSVRLWVTTTRDVTDRWRAAEALAAEKERLSVALASIADGVVAADVDGRIVLMNEVAERLTGWSSVEAAGRTVLEVVRMAERGWRAAAEDGYGLHGRQVLVARDGRVVPVERRATPLRDAQGRVLGEVVVLRDISEALRREEERIQAQKLESLAVLAGGIAHDFNNLLTGIQGNLSLSLAAREVPDDVRGWLQDALAAGERSQGLTQQLLTFARGGAPVRKVSDLRQPVRQAAAFAGLGSRVVCRVEADPDLWPVDADVGQIAQVVQNLVLNAVEATPGSGEVEVQCLNRLLAAGNEIRLPPGPYVCLRVVDHGSGIPEDIRPRIFDPYFSTKQRRSGLGLAITHSIVVRHGGRLLPGTTPGGGTTFEVYLPALPTAVVPADAAARVPLRDGGSVLVMDDDPFVRRVAQRALAHLGCRVVTAADGREAVDAYGAALREKAPFDVVLMDLTVPGGIGGVEAMAAIRAIDPDVRAIVMSGYSDNPVMASHAEYGFAAVLPKPFTIERLEEALAAVRRAPAKAR